MKAMLLVALGGAVGSVGRWLVSSWLVQQAVGWKFPAGTFAVNVLGCLAAGILAAIAEKNELFTPELRILVFTGLLGGFTTFSAFGLETFYLMKRGDIAIAAANIVLSVVAGLAALWIGYAAGARWPQ